MMGGIRTRRAQVILFVCAVVPALCAPSASAAVLPAVCSGSTGSAPSLIGAITTANLDPGPDTVTLGADCTYTLGSVDNNWYGPNGLPAISGDVTVEGNGATIARFAAAPNFRLFFVGADPASLSTSGYVSPGPGKLTLREVTLRGGLARGGAAFLGGGGAGMGGAIFSQGTVVIERSTLTANTAEGGSSNVSTAGNGGGGIGTDSVIGSGAGLGDTGGGFGGGAFGGANGGQGSASGAAGGGAGFRAAESGNPALDPLSPGAGGGPQTGTGGQGGVGAAGGDGSGGGGGRGGEFQGGDGGSFGAGGGGGGGVGDTDGGGGGGGGGVGGGGGQAGAGGGGGGGGFGAGGGVGGATSEGGVGGSGGFGGGGGAGWTIGGVPGFGGGVPVGPGGGGAGMGGAIFTMQGELTVRNSTFSANSAIGGGPAPPGKGLGGAVFNLSGSFTAVGSTLAANSAADDGASIYNLVYDAVTARQAQTTLQNTIVSGGLTSGSGVDLASDKPATTAGPSLGSATASVADRNLVQTMAARNGGQIVGSPLTADPLLGPLQDNGGPTQTMAPAEGSPVIDAGSAFGLTTDQRGLSRPFDFSPIANTADGSDIGAVELPLTRPGGESPGPITPTRPAFGARTLVTLRLAARRIPARGPLTIIVANRNGFGVSGKLSGQTTRRIALAQRTRRVKLSAKTFSVAANARKSVKLKLPKALRRVLRRRGKLSLRLTARVKDPAGNTRTVRKRVSPKLKMKLRRAR